MRKLVFTDPAARQRLERIVHPLVAQATREAASRAVQSGAALIVFDIPLLVESARWAQQLDQILVVDCTAETQISRVQQRSALARETIEGIMASQAPARSGGRQRTWWSTTTGSRCKGCELTSFRSPSGSGYDARHIRTREAGSASRVPQEPCSVILYEYPFNERLRTYLRLEQLFRRLGELIPRQHPLDHHYALVTVFEIMDVAARADLKSDVLKDLEKQKHQLDGYRGNPSISEAVLDGIIAQLDRCFAGLNAQTGKAGQALAENDWLMSIRSRVGIPGEPAASICRPTTPGSTMPPAAPAGSGSLGDHPRPLAESLYVLLKLLRDSGVPQKVAADHGQFQQTLPQGRTFQLLRLRIDPSLDLIPEISGNRLIVSVRLMRQHDDGKLHAANEDAAFELTLCA